jgi:hypothetical protein
LREQDILSSSPKEKAKRATRVFEHRTLDPANACNIFHSQRFFVTLYAPAG